MNLTQLKINGIENPLGFEMDHIQCSWKVEHALGTKQTWAGIRVSEKEDMSEPVYTKEDSGLTGRGELLEFLVKPKTRYYYSVEVHSDKGEQARGDGWFETSKMDEPWQASWICMEETDEFHPEFVREFTVEKEVAQARLYVSGVGLYEAYVNGQKAGEDFLAPFTGDYSEVIQYQTYDVTQAIRRENRMAILCGNGWYKGRLGYEGHSAVYGDRFAVIAELEITFMDGSSQCIITDESWQYAASDIVSSDIYNGEEINRCQQPKVYRKALRYDGLTTELLTARRSLPLVPQETLLVQKIIHTPAGETVLDFGQNFAGYVEFSSAKLAKGSRIVLDFGEILQQGNFYNANYRTAKAQMVYTADGRNELVRPHFTFYGFRYVRVSGWPGELVPEDFTGRAVYSKLPVTGSFECSDGKINRLFWNCMWGQKSNFIDMPMDCPQRDERLGWTGDAQVFAPTASFNMYTKEFYRKYLEDLHREQNKWGGAVPNYIPNYTKTPGGAAVWGDAAVFIPMTLYEYYGDRLLLAHHFPMMREWVDYLTAQCKAHHSGGLIQFGMQFGDWLAMDGITEQSFKGGTDEYYLASVYYYASVRMVASAACILGYEELGQSYSELADGIRGAILNEYFSGSGRLCIDTQAAYVVSLRFGIYRDKKRVTEGFLERLRKDCYRIRCGFVGAPVLCRILAENDMVKLAYRILFYEGFPGWLHCVKLGATTIWERWNSVLDDGTVSGCGMNSLNHYSYGAVIEFLYRQTAGIEPLEPGFGRVRIAPKPDYRMREVNCGYDSVSGEYRVSYRLLAGGKVWIRVEVPFGCTALLKLPGCDETVELCAGVYEREYQADVNLCCPFDEDSILEELKTCSEAVEVLKELVPAAYGMLQGNDKECMALSLKNMMGMPYMGFEPAAVAEAAEKIRQIEVRRELYESIDF